MFDTATEITEHTARDDEDDTTDQNLNINVNRGAAVQDPAEILIAALAGETILIFFNSLESYQAISILDE